MKPQNALVALFLITLILSFSIVGFNYSVDPFCYNCTQIEINRPNLNRYYQVAQLIAGAPETELIVLGSSRGETTSPMWIQEMTGLKTLNLSKAGAEIIAKKAFLSLALEKSKLKKIIWYADYFELISTNADPVFRKTKSLNTYANSNLLTNNGPSFLRQLQGLIDHNTTEASVAALRRTMSANLKQGEGSRLDYSQCLKSDYNNEKTQQGLDQQVELIYQSYIHGAIAGPQSSEAIDEFESLINKVAKLGISVFIIIPPYHPLFMSRLKSEYPRIYDAHIVWINKIKKLESSQVVVEDYFTTGIPHDDGSPRYWNDGAHFTCKGVIQMLGNHNLNSMKSD